MKRVRLTGKAWPTFARFDDAPMLVDFRYESSHCAMLHEVDA
jgi:hypothetical protein